MRLEQLLKLAHEVFQGVGAPHAIIGAFGMSAYGYQRATNDIDFLVHGDFRAQVEEAFFRRGFSVFHANEEVLQLGGPGPIDIIFARRPLSKQMLAKTPTMHILDVPVLDVEDIIGLKIQALATNSKRKFKDLGDIQALVQATKNLDWSRIKTYADLFNVWDLISEIKEEHEDGN